MARGPYQGTWEYGNRPTVVTAPDALVFINGEQDIIGCQSCRRRFDFNKFITSIQVDLSVDSCPGSASVSLSIPRHAIDKFFVDGVPLVTPMMEIEIYAKGYFLVEGVPQYYPIFWGLITEVTDNYSSGEHTVSINCSDILKWWELCRMNINPAFTSPQPTQNGRSIFGNVFFGMNPYDIIWTLAQQAYGDVVVGTGTLVSLYKEASQASTFNHAMTDMMLYWQQRFSKIRSNLLLYGTRGNAVRGDMLYAQYQKTGAGKTVGKAHPFASQEVRNANGGNNGSQMIYDPTDPNVTAFRTQFQQAGQVNFWSSEYQTKLELANAAKESIGFEFYMDVTGDIVFKPPFYNLDILSNKPVSWIQDIDIIDWNLGDSEAEVVTQIQISGSFGGNIDYGMPEEATPYTSVTDYHLLRKYGWRPQTFNSEFMGSPLLMFYTGMDLLDRYNSKRFRGSVSIPMRPELRLGFPVYLASKDQIWYISGISHNLTFGGRAQTTLTLTAKRNKFYAPKGIGSIELVGPKSSTPLTAKQLSEQGRFKADIGDAAEIPPINQVVSGKPGDLNPYEPLILRHPKTGRIVGYPNVVMAYTRPFTPPPDSLTKVTGKNAPGTKRKADGIKDFNKAAAGLAAQADADFQSADANDALKAKYLNNRYQYGLNSAGVYTYLHDRSAVIQEFVILKAQNITFDEETNSKLFPGGTGMIRPVSDDRGFEVIGHFKYGRGVTLRDGSLIINENDSNSRATIDTQLALSGGLFETLRAQSSGLSSKTADLYPNPAAAITNLQPEDLQTAGRINPSTKQPEFAGDPTTNFVDVAPLGSAEQLGSHTNEQVSVEASQFSRALTLLEMRAKDSLGNTVGAECECNISTSDLAFIAVGYQLKTLNSSASEDTSTITFGAMGESGNQLNTTQTQALAALNKQQQQEADAAAARARQHWQNDATASEDAVHAAEQQARSEATSRFIQAHYDEYSAAGVNPTAASLGYTGTSGPAEGPVGDKDIKAGLTPEKVNAFLSSLYTALDESHQQWEKALRGELYDGPRVDPQQVRFGVPKSQGGISAPYDSGRQIGGNPADIAKMGADAREQVAEEWAGFAEELKSNSERVRLQGEIQRLQKRANELASDAGDLEAALAGNGVVGPDQNAPGYSPQQQLSDLQAELDKTLTDLQKAQQDLNVLNAKYPR